MWTENELTGEKTQQLWENILASELILNGSFLYNILLRRKRCLSEWEGLAGNI